MGFKKLSSIAERYDRGAIAIILTYLIAFVWIRRLAVPIILLVLFGSFSDMYIPVLIGWLGIILILAAPFPQSRTVQFRLQWIGMFLLPCSWLLFFALSDIKWITVCGSVPFLVAAIWNAKAFGRALQVYREQKKEESTASSSGA